MSEDPQHGVLPEGWALTPFSELIVHVLGGDWGKAPDATPNGWIDVRVIRGTEFRDWAKEKGRSAAHRCVKPTTFERRRLQAGDLVIEISGGGPDQPVGRPLLLDEAALAQADYPLICSNFCRQVRVTDELDPRFVLACLQHLYNRGEFNRFQNQTVNIRNLQFPEFAAETLLPIPPYAEQQRIVAQVEALLAKVNAASARLAGVPAILRRFRQSVLAAACSGQLTTDWRETHAEAPRPSSNEEEPAVLDEWDGLPEIPDEWCWTTLRDVSNYQGGHAYKSKLFSEKDTGNQVLRIGNVRRGYVDESIAQVFITDNYANETERFELRVNDVLVSQTGTRYKRDYGFVGLVQQSSRRLFLNQRVSRLRCKSDRTDARYVYVWLQTEPYRDCFFKDETGNVNQGNVGSKPLKTGPIALPPLSEQEEIVRRIEALSALAGKVANRVEWATKRATALTQSILRAAFRGVLVPTEAELAQADGREYEPASVLLERIRAQRVSEPSRNDTPRGRKRVKKQVAANSREGNEPNDDTHQPVAPKSNGKVPHVKSSATAPAALADYTTENLMAEFRAALWGAGEITETDLLRDVARRLGYQRLGKSIRAELQGHLRAAIRRQIIARDGDYVTCPTSIFRNYDADFLAARLKSVMLPGRQYTRDDVLTNLATYLGFRHVTDAVRDHMKPIFNSAIRQGNLAYRGKWIWRES